MTDPTVEDECSACSGLGLCEVCAGEGKFADQPCTNCDGSGDCPDCGGSGYEAE